MELLNKVGELLVAKTLVVSYVTSEVKKARQEVCNACERRDQVANRCKICKCFLAVKTGTAENLNPTKLRYEVTHCPLGKWDDKEIANQYREIDGLTPLS